MCNYYSRWATQLLNLHWSEKSSYKGESSYCEFSVSSLAKRPTCWSVRSNNSRGEIITTHNHGSSLATALIHDRWPRLFVTPDCFYYTWTYESMSECNRTFGGLCCPFIPNNTSPDGSMTRGPNSSLRRWLKTPPLKIPSVTRWRNGLGDGTES